VQNLIRLLSSLPASFLNHPDQFVVCGSGPMAVRGMRDVRDLDLLVSADLFSLAPSFGFGTAGVEFYAEQNESDGDVSARRLLQRIDETGKIDLFLTTPKLGHTLEEQVERGVDWYPRIGAMLQFQNLPDVLAIKLGVIQAKRPSAPKHVADLIDLTARIVHEAGTL
jgi:hypothetical protein